MPLIAMKVGDETNATPVPVQGQIVLDDRRGSAGFFAPDSMPQHLHHPLFLPILLLILVPLTFNL